MDELKAFIELIKELPQLAIWVLVVFYVYKVICIGSIYGVIRFIATKLHDWATNKNPSSAVDDAYVIDSARYSLTQQLLRIRNKSIDSGSPYIHAGDVAWLRKAIDEKEARDAEAKK